jgi:hypothetical protein
LWTALGDAVILAVSYLAIEPWARRQWPDAMIIWSRVLEGRWRDAAVARDVLLGLAWAVAAGLYLMLRHYVDIRLGDAPSWSFAFAAPQDPGSGREVVAAIVFSLRLGVVMPLFLFSLLVFLWMLVRKRSIAVVIVTGFAVFLESASARHAADWLFSAGAVAVFMFAIQRFGLFVTMVYIGTVYVISNSLLTNDLTAWYGLSSMLTVVLISALALAAFRLSLGGRSMFEVQAGP